MISYLAFLATLNDFGFVYAELESISKLLGIRLELKRDGTDLSPFLELMLEGDEHAESICRRSVTIFGLYEVMGCGVDYEGLMESIRDYMVRDVSRMERYLKDVRYKFYVRGYGRRYSREEIMERVRRFGWMGWDKAKVDLVDPEMKFWIFEDFSGDERGRYKEIPNRIWFVRQVSESARELVARYSLKKRVYLGTTSMESEISLLTANQALARMGSIIIDPFVGTGSLILACAHFGAYVMGGDIDMRVLKGKKQFDNDRCDINSNFEQYGLSDRLIGLVRFDNCKNDCFFIKNGNRSLFDAIVCDPPYGIRAGPKKVGIKKNTLLKHLKLGHGADYFMKINDPNDPNWLPHIPQCIPYKFSNVLSDLLEFASKSLITHGRLVFWLPNSTRNPDLPKSVPSHPSLKLISISEQIVSTKFSRNLITMEKI